MLSYHFVFLICGQLFANFLKIAFFFGKRVQKSGFSNFCFLSPFLKIPVLGVCQNTIKMGGWGFSKVCVTHNSFQKKSCWNLYFYSVVWVHAFWAKVSKKGNFEKTPKKKPKLTDNWKAPFLVFLCFFVASFFSCFSCFFLFVFFCVFLEGLRVRWGGPKGHLTWPWTLLIY